MPGTSMSAQGWCRRYLLMAYQPAGQMREQPSNLRALAVRLRRVLVCASSSLSMISAESTESRPSRFAVASRAWTRQPRPEGWQLRGGRGRSRR
jgi:hypothetical protein